MKCINTLTIVLFGLFLSSQFITAQTGTKKHNILFISVDDFRPKINSYGESNMITPNIDKLASEGLQFNMLLLTLLSVGLVARVL